MRQYGDESLFTRSRVDMDLDKVLAATEVEKAYIAGFLDGEGSVGIYKSRRTFVLAVSFAQKNPAILLWIQSIYGGTLVSQKPEHSGFAAADIVFQLRYTSRSDVIVLLRSLRPYIRVKKDQVDAVFDFFSLPDDAFEEKSNIVELVKALKHG